MLGDKSLAGPGCSVPWGPGWSPWRAGGRHRVETSEESHVPCPAGEPEPNWKWMSEQAVNPEDLASNRIKTMGQKGTSSNENMSQCHYLWDHLINC